MRRLRELTEEERKTMERLVQARNTPGGKRKRAQIIWLASQGQRTPEMAKQLEVSERMGRNRLHRFNEQGFQGLEEAPRSGRPVTSDPALVSEIIQTALSRPQDVGEEDDATGTRDRLGDSLHRVTGIRRKRSRIREMFIAEGLRWRPEATWCGERVDPDVAHTREPSQPSTPARLLAALPSVSITWVPWGSRGIQARA
jgi:transposase